MRRVIFEEKGGPEVLKFQTPDLPSPATGEVRIKIKAIGLIRSTPGSPSVIQPAAEKRRRCIANRGRDQGVGLLAGAL